MIWLEMEKDKARPSGGSFREDFKGLISTRQIKLLKVIFLGQKVRVSPRRHTTEYMSQTDATVGKILYFLLKI